jgi:hypothetical protein
MEKGRVIVYLASLIVVSLLTSSCIREYQHAGKDILPAITTIRSTDWLMSGFLLAIVLGVFAGLNGIKAGWLGAVASFVGLLVKAALSQTWVYWWLGCILVGGALATIASVLLKNKALRELITSVQCLRQTEWDGKTHKAEMTEVLQDLQSKPTQRLVLREKVKLKERGEL